MNKRKLRWAQFKAAAGGMSLSQELLQGARALLQLALEERRRPVYRAETNHYSSYAPGGIVLLVDALEAWLNELIVYLWPFSHQQAQRCLAFEPPRKKYYEIPRQFASVAIPENADLDLVIELRHEIAHYLPRGIPEEGNVPEWFRQLHQQGMFITTGESEADFVLGAKLGSYRLAYWVWETVDSAVSNLANALGQEAEPAKWTASNFTCYRVVCSPSQLPQYDLKHKLCLT